jgi:hypothetical protein
MTTEPGSKPIRGRDAVRPATALVQLVSSDEPPLRWAAGADAVATFEDKAQTLIKQADAYRELSSSLAHDNVS